MMQPYNTRVLILFFKYYRVHVYYSAYDSRTTYICRSFSETPLRRLFAAKLIFCYGFQ